VSPLRIRYRVQAWICHLYAFSAPPSPSHKVRTAKRERRGPAEAIVQPSGLGAAARGCWGKHTVEEHHPRFQAPPDADESPAGEASGRRLESVSIERTAEILGWLFSSDQPPFAGPESTVFDVGLISLRLQPSATATHAACSWRVQCDLDRSHVAGNRRWSLAGRKSHHSSAPTICGRRHLINCGDPERVHAETRQQRFLLMTPRHFHQRVLLLLCWFVFCFFFFFFSFFFFFLFPPSPPPPPTTISGRTSSTLVGQSPTSLEITWRRR